MIALEDCIGLCGLSREEVLALAEHEQIPEINATALAQHLLSQPEGCRKIAAMIADDMCWAVQLHDERHAQALKETLRHFVTEHPEGWASLRTRACLNS